MAKKKVSHIPKQTNGEDSPAVLQERQIGYQSSAAAMDVSAENEMLQNLKLLNNVLVKETSDCRKKVESLALEKVALETELNMNGLEKEAMKIGLTDASEQNVGLELEKCVVFAFMETQIGEIRAGFGELMREKTKTEEIKREKEVENGLLSKKVEDLQGTLENERAEVRKVVCERNAAMRELNDVSKKTEELRKKLNEMEHTERMFIEEGEKLRFRCKSVEAEDEKHLIIIDETRREMDLVKRKLKESEMIIADLEGKIKEIVKEKEEIWAVKNGFEVKSEELERNVKKLNAGVFSLTGENKILASKILELEMNLHETAEKETTMVMEGKILTEELKENKESILVLIQKNDSLEYDLNLAREESKVLAHKIEILIREKTEIGEEKVKGESTIDELKAVLVTLEDKWRVEKEKSKQLVTEVSHCRDALDRITLEKENTDKDLDVERTKSEKVRLEILGMQKRVEESEKELKQTKREQKDQLKMRNGMESRIELLEKDKGLAEKKLLEAQTAIDDLKGKIKSALTKSDRALAMVKKTVKFLCDSKDNRAESEINGRELEEEIIPFVAELNTMKIAFKNKEKLVEEMKMEVEAEKAKRQKRRRSFFTLLTTATTILAAASAVYVTKAR